MGSEGHELVQSRTLIPDFVVLGLQELSFLQHFFYDMDMSAFD